MGWKDALQGAVSKGAEEKIKEHWPAVQKMFREKVGPQLREQLNDPAKVISASKVVYSLLPMPVRFVVKEEPFVNFCLEHKDELLG